MNPLKPEKLNPYEIMNRGYNDQSGTIYMNCGLNQMRLRSKTPNFLSSYVPEPIYENPKQEDFILESLDRNTKEKKGRHVLKINTGGKDADGDLLELPSKELSV